MATVSTRPKGSQIPAELPAARPRRGSASGGAGGSASGEAGGGADGSASGGASGGAPERPPALRVRSVPESRPPAVVWAGRPLPPREQQMLALDLADLQPEPARQTLVRDVRTWNPEPPPRLPDPYAWSLSLAQAIIEALQRRRPTSQLTRWVDEAVMSEINLQARSERLESERPGPTLIRSVRLQFPREQVIEVAIHVTREGRSSAMALRLESRDTRWLCTALELGPRAPICD